LEWIRRVREWLRGTSPAVPQAPARIVIGLGNPGAKYAGTRHNVGFRVVELLATRCGGEWSDDASLEARVARVELGGQSCLLVQPQTFMNRSGRTVAAAVECWPSLDPSLDLLVVYDDIDLPTGRIRLRPSGGAGGHRGMGDILDELGTKSIPRLRFGVGHPGKGEQVIDWVLARFSPADEVLLEPALERSVEAVTAVLQEGVPVAMGQFNAET
jgi:PTH1 family peptidyl-tRNA hydrolase